MELEQQERIALDLLSRAWNAFCALPTLHDADAREFCQAIHAAQNIILARPAMRLLGNEWYGEKAPREGCSTCSTSSRS